MSWPRTRSTIGRLGALALLAALPSAAQDSGTTSVKPETLAAFYDYIRTTEARIEGEIRNPSRFLWAAQTNDRLSRVRNGEAVVEPYNGKGEIEIKHGMIHDWIGSVFVPGATLPKTLATVQDYDKHKNWFKPEVMDSRLILRSGDDFRIYMRLLKKKVITVVLNTEHHATYRQLGPKRCYSRSYTTKITEVQNAGKPDERESAPGHDHGFLWKLHTYWRFEERDGGVFIECQAISLTRDVPTGLGWLINPIIRNLPRESLANTLTGTRKAIQ